MSESQTEFLKYLVLIFIRNLILLLDLIIKNIYVFKQNGAIDFENTYHR